MDQEPRRIVLTPKLVDSLYVEAMVLADEARSYFDVQAEEDRAQLEPGVRVHFACESLRVTTRLMHIIAWLLTQRAVAAGEISASEAREPERRLDDAKVEVTLAGRFWAAKSGGTQGNRKRVIGKLPGELTGELPGG